MNNTEILLVWTDSSNTSLLRVPRIKLAFISHRLTQCRYVTDPSVSNEFRNHQYLHVFISPVKTPLGGFE